MALTNHILPDSPTNNFATLNPLVATSTTFSDGNLYIPAVVNANLASYHITTGKWYCEVLTGINSNWNYFISFKNEDTGKYAGIGFCNGGNSPDTFTILQSGLTGTITLPTGNRVADAVLGVTLDMDGGNVYFYYNGVLNGKVENITDTDWNQDVVLTIENFTATHTYHPVRVNFGQDPTFAGSKSPTTTYTDANGIGAFFYQPPTGAKALCTANLPEMTPDVADDVPQDYFKTVIWTGDGNYPRTISTDFAPDLIWTKARTLTPTNNLNSDHLLMDSVRGDGNLKWISSSQTNAEGTYYSNATANLTSSGFTIQSTTGTNCLNDNNAKFVAWCFRAGGNSNTFNINGTGYSTYSALQNDNTSLPAITSGMIEPSGMSINKDAGFSIVSYTGNGDNATVPHGLNSAPEMLIVKNRTTASTYWCITTKYIQDTYGNSYVLLLPLPNGVTTNSTIFNSTQPTSSVFSIGTNGGTNTDGDNYIAYCWHSVEGFSKIGSYEGSTALPFVYTGFRPSFLILKNADDSTSWVIHDSSRDVYNEVENVLVADAFTEEKTYSTTGVDFLSNGFKMRGDSSWYGNNLSTTQTVIYMAFAEQPFKFSNAR